MVMDADMVFGSSSGPDNTMAPDLLKCYAKVRLTVSILERKHET